jgi:hypothetical protein
MCLTNVALFGFGKTINALDAWANGKDVAMVTENDKKSQWMPLVSHTSRNIYQVERHCAKPQ